MQKNLFYLSYSVKSAKSGMYYWHYDRHSSADLYPLWVDIGMAQQKILDDFTKKIDKMISETGKYPSAIKVKSLFVDFLLSTN